MNIEQLKGEQGLQLGRDTLQEVLQAGLPLTPQNYELWLHSVGGFDPEVKAAIEKTLEEQGSPLPIEAADALYDEFFAQSKLSYQVIDAGAKIAQELAGALAALKDAGVMTSKFTETLNNSRETLAGDEVQPDELKSVVAALAEATREMKEQNASLTAKLETSTREVETLRSGLQEARAEALVDALTGVANRKLFDETMETRFSEARDLDYSLTLVLCDIDRFKAFNDTWGHQTGDQVIRFVAGSLSRHSKSDQLVARYGGEEFAIIMPRTDLDEAAHQCERIRKAIEAKRLMRRSTNESLGTVTISMGIAKLNPTDSIQSLIERADASLYASKRNGRNRVTREDDPTAKAA